MVVVVAQWGGAYVVTPPSDVIVHYISKILYVGDPP